MLKEFLQSISGPVSNIAFTYPSSNGFGGPTVTPQGMFTKLMNVLSSGSYGGASSNSLSAYTNIQGQNLNPAAVQAYINSLNGYAAGTGSKKREAFSPGSVVNSLQLPPMPQAIPTSYSQTGQLVAAINPLQGFANSQTGITNGALSGTVGALGTVGGLMQPGQMIPGLNGFSPMGFGSSSGFGKWSMFLMPLISLVGLVKSLFSLRGGIGSMKPTPTDRDTLAYQSSLTKYAVEDRTEGNNFDDSDNYWGEGESGEGSFDSSKLEM